MPATTAIGIPYPTPGDPPNVPGDILALAAFLDTYLGGNYASAEKLSAQNIPDSTFTTITAWTNVNLKDITYGTGIWTVAKAGYYVVTGQLSFPPNGSPAGQRVSRLVVNGNPVSEYSRRPDVTFNAQLPFAWGGLLSAGDTIRVQAYQSQGATEPIEVDPGQCNVTIHRASAV